MLEKISLNKTERKELDGKVKKILKKLKNKDITFFVGGSYAKNTFLKEDLDVDVFAKFNYKKYQDKDISKELKKFLKSKFRKKVKIVHASRDYYHISEDKISFEIVPVLDIRKTKDAKNIMDVSPMHVKFVKRKTNKKLQDEIRILKQFCKANDLYGAESYIRGFSGYVLELLIIKYGSFDKLVENARKWSEEEVIYFGRNKEKALRELNKSKKVSPLIVIDPVQENRNAAAAIGKKNYKKFISLCKAYNGNKTFFVKEEVLIDKLKKDHIIFEITPFEGKKDIVGSKLLSLLERMKKEFEGKEFKIKNYGWKFEDKVHFWFKANKLPRKKIHQGPKVKDKNNSLAFMKKWKNVKISKGRTYVVLERKFTIPADFARNLIKEKWLKEKVKDIKLI